MDHRGGPSGLGIVVAALVLAVARAPALGQCAEGWSPGFGFPGPSGIVFALAPLPNGDIVVAGAFESAGGVGVNNIARWDGLAWHALGAGVDGPSNPAIYALTILPNGNLVAAGIFSSAGGAPANNIARWNGASWLPLGNGLAYYPSLLAAMPNGDVAAAGLFSPSVALFDGAEWSSIGPGTGIITALARLSNGTLVAARAFTSGGTRVSEVLRWNAGAWTPLGTTLTDGAGGDPNVSCILELGGADLVVGGRFSSIGNNVARWNGSAWSPLGTGTNIGLNALARLPNGDTIAGGAFTAAGGVAAHGIARWNGSAWSPLGSGVAGAGPSVLALAALSNGDLIVAGQFTSAGGSAADRVARYSTGANCCPADLDDDGNSANGGVRDGAVGIEDLLYFLPEFEDGSASVDIDNDGLDPATPDGAVTIDDLIAFLRHFESGC